MRADVIEASVGDARFFARSCPQALAAIATVAKGAAPAIERSFIGVAPLQSAGPEHVSYCAELGKCTLRVGVIGLCGLYTAESYGPLTNEEIPRRWWARLSFRSAIR